MLVARTSPSAARSVPARRSSNVAAAAVGRRDLLASLSGILMATAAQQRAASAAVQDKRSDNSTGASSSSSGSGSSFMAITPVDSSFKSYQDERDSAMDYKCKGGMFDCDGDRAEFAKKQYEDWLSAGGVPKRIREGRPEGPRSY